MRPSTLTRKTPMPRSTKPLARSAIRSEAKTEGAKVRKPMKSKGPRKMPKPSGKNLRSKQLAVTSEEKVLWDRLAALGCIACMKDGNYQPHVSIHHVDGRTKPGCHKLVLPLCAGHHQDGTGVPGLIAVHPWKARFEKIYGAQLDLVAECMELVK